MTAVRLTPGRRRNKFGNKKTAGYDSRRESRRATTLHVMQRIGEISELKEQVPFELIPKQVDEQGRCLERACQYVADFTYRDANGDLVVEDSKGCRLKEYVIKRKLMLWVHGIRVREV